MLVCLNQRRTDKTMVKMKNDKRTNNDLERTTEKTKDYKIIIVTRIIFNNKSFLTGWDGLIRVLHRQIK
jgi:hypothetical protein